MESSVRTACTTRRSDEDEKVPRCCAFVKPESLELRSRWSDDSRRCLREGTYEIRLAFGVRSLCYQHIIPFREHARILSRIRGFPNRPI